MIKKINILIAILFLLFVFASGAMAQPKVLIENPVYTFESVPEGTHVVHKFKVKNMGDSILKITEVKPP